MKALVIYKKSQYQIYVEERKNAHINGLLKSGSDAVRGMLAAHEAHNRCLDTVHKVLETEGISYRSRYRAGLDMVKDADIVFSVGGDGTLLWTQKFVGRNIPVFGVNSDSARSVGALCACTESDFRKTLQSYLKSHKNPHDAQPHEVGRLEVTINGNVISSRVLNDVLFSHRNPAAVTSYILRTTPEYESQKSSGIWVCTAVGSTGAMKSAGGKVMGFRTHMLQWRVREPYEPGATKYKYTSGMIEYGDTFSVMSKVRDGIIALDGSRDLHKVEMGDLVHFTNSPEPLTLIK